MNSNTSIVLGCHTRQASLDDSSSTPREHKPCSESDEKRSGVLLPLARTMPIGYHPRVPVQGPSVSEFRVVKAAGTSLHTLCHDTRSTWQMVLQDWTSHSNGYLTFSLAFSIGLFKDQLNTVAMSGYVASFVS